LYYGFYTSNSQGLFNKNAGRTGIFKSGPLDSKWTAQIESGKAGRRSGRNSDPTAISMAAPWPEMSISRYRALSRERKTPAGREHKYELTTSENEVDDEPRKTCGLERRTVAVR
jgi:hypothetical protein